MKKTELEIYRDMLHKKYGGPVGHGMGHDDSFTWRRITDEECAEYRRLERAENSKWKEGIERREAALRKAFG